VYHLTEITPDDFSQDGAVSPAANPLRYRVASACDHNRRDSAHVWQQLQAVKGNFRKKAVAAVLYLVKLAQAGQPLSDMLDGKALHEAHSFHSPVSGRMEKIWRYRRAQIRVLFYYADGKVVFLTGVLVKLEDKFSPGDLRAAEKAINEYLQARADGLLAWVE
jgi:mRNA-degrading endonuclease RelE of RelBE toxin-antitoxin system